MSDIGQCGETINSDSDSDLLVSLNVTEDISKVISGSFECGGLDSDSEHSTDQADDCSGISSSVWSYLHKKSKKRLTMMKETFFERYEHVSLQDDDEIFDLSQLDSPAVHEKLKKNGVPKEHIVNMPCSMPSEKEISLYNLIRQKALRSIIHEKVMKDDKSGTCITPKVECSKKVNANKGTQVKSVDDSKTSEIATALSKIGLGTDEATGIDKDSIWKEGFERCSTPVRKNRETTKSMTKKRYLCGTEWHGVLNKSRSESARKFKDMQDQGNVRNLRPRKSLCLSLSDYSEMDCELESSKLLKQRKESSYRNQQQQGRHSGSGKLNSSCKGESLSYSKKHIYSGTENINTSCKNTSQCATHQENFKHFQTRRSLSVSEKCLSTRRRRTCNTSNHSEFTSDLEVVQNVKSPHKSSRTPLKKSRLKSPRTPLKNSRRKSPRTPVKKSPLKSPKMPVKKSPHKSPKTPVKKSTHKLPRTPVKKLPHKSPRTPVKKLPHKSPRTTVKESTVIKRSTPEKMPITKSHLFLNYNNSSRFKYLNDSFDSLTTTDGATSIGSNNPAIYTKLSRSASFSHVSSGSCSPISVSLKKAPWSLNPNYKKK